MSKDNPFHWLYKEEEVDKHLERGWEYETASIPNGEYDLDGFIAMLKVYAFQNVTEGPLAISVRTNHCDPFTEYSFYHQKPLTDEDRKMLKDQRQAIRDREEAHDLGVVKQFRLLKQRRGQEWVDAINDRMALEDLADAITE